MPNFIFSREVATCTVTAAAAKFYLIPIKNVRLFFSRQSALLLVNIFDDSETDERWLMRCDQIGRFSTDWATFERLPLSPS